MSGDAPGAAPGAILEKDQREYLWQVEHHGLILSRHGFSRLAQALRRNEPAAFLSLLADGDGFEGASWISRVRCGWTTATCECSASVIPVRAPSSSIASGL